jgi:acylpyruvate hydrolase
MKLVTYCTKDEQSKKRLGFWVQGRVIDLVQASLVFCPAEKFLAQEMEELLAAGLEGWQWAEKVTNKVLYYMENIENIEDEKNFSALPLKKILFKKEEINFLPPLTRPGKIICIGLNYYDHCEEQKAKIPVSPIIFAKFNTALCATKQPVIRPSTTTQLDYEAELAVIIGKKGRNIQRQEAPKFIAGYTIMNDVTARDIQRRDRQWVRSKTFDTFAPLGPFLVTADEIIDPQNLYIRCWVNGVLRQNSSTAQMIFSLNYLITFISQVMTLLPGDIIATGTPAGVGAFCKPPAYLEPGDVIQIEIEKIGVLENYVVDENS